MASPTHLATEARFKNKVLTPQVAALIHEIATSFERRLLPLQDQRQKHRERLAAGEVAYRDETAHIRKQEWTVDPVPEQLRERRVELIGGATRSELVNGLNSGAKTYLADLCNFSRTDTWSVLRAHRNLERAARLDLAFLPAEGGRIRINPRTNTRLSMVPRSLFAQEDGLLVNEKPVSAGIFDVVMMVVNSGRPLLQQWDAIHLMLRDVQTHLEARLWSQLFDQLEEHLEIPRGSIRATVMVDSVSAALEADEILFELMHHSAGLSQDPQGYATDHIALFHGNDRQVLPDRELIGLNSPFLRALGHHIIGICHRRGCHAIGSPSFVLPPLDPEKLKSSYLEMLADKEREAVDGFDGSIVVHAETVNPAMVEFNKSMPRANQLYYQRNDDIKPEDLIRRPEGNITIESLTGAIRTCLRAMVQLNEGRGWVIQGGRMHDRSSIRFALCLLWQWVHSSHGVITSSGLDVHDDLLKYLVKKESDRMFAEADDLARQLAVEKAKELLAIVLGEVLPA